MTNAVLIEHVFGNWVNCHAFTIENDFYNVDFGFPTLQNCSKSETTFINFCLLAGVTKHFHLPRFPFGLIFKQFLGHTQHF